MKDISSRSVCPTSSSKCASECASCTNDINPLLVGIDKVDREHLDENRTSLSYGRGEVIFKAGTFPSGLFCLNRGNVMILKEDSFGNKVATNLVKEVEFVGVSDYLSGLSYKSTCIALSDVRVCVIRADAVEDLIRGNSSLSRRLLAVVSKMSQQCNDRLLSLTKKNMNARVADALLELLSVYGVADDGCLDVYLKREEIALICNMNVTNVIRHLSSLDRQGIIRLEGKKIAILDEALLRKESVGAVVK